MVPWYKKVVNKVGDSIKDAADAVVDGATDILEDGTDLVKNGKCYETVSSLQKHGAECFTLAKETSDLCETTQTRGQEMMDFGNDITSTLQGFSNKMNAETLETIKDLMDGDKLQASLALAQDMDDIALSCIDKSCRMIAIMEETMDTVPEPVQKIMTKIAGKDDAKSEMDQKRTRSVLSTLDQDLDDGKACMKALENLNIASALSLGTRAFENLSKKAAVSRDMFSIMKDFSDEVVGYTEAISEGDFGDMFKLAAKVKDMWHCLKLSDFMRQLAEAAAKLIRVMIDLFKSMAGRLSTLWAALAFAKDCMMDCIQHVLDAKNLILGAQEKCSMLKQHSRSISLQLDDLDNFNMDSIKAMQKLREGGEINDAIDIACSMDDLVVDCSKKVVAMVERVTEGVRNLPEIVVVDVDLDEQGKRDDDPEVNDVEENIRQLEHSREAIDKSDIVTATKASMRGFRGALDIEDTCEEMLSIVRGFAGDCNSVIESFLGVFDLDNAMIKISEMCRIVRLGDLIKQFADQIKRLLKAIVALMKAIVKKISIENLSKIDLGDAMDGAVEAAKEAMDDIKDKLQFWKK